MMPITSYYKLVHNTQYSTVLFFFFFILFSPLTTLAQDGCTQASIGTGVLNTLISARVGNNPIAAQTQTAAAIQTTICQPLPRIKIPGLQFTSAETLAQNIYTNPQDGSTYLFIPFLGEYISAVYHYGIALAGVVIVLILIVSGIQWILSGTNPDNIDAAKERIKNAMAGLFIITTTYTFLYIINPELTSFKSLKLELIKPQAISPNEDLTAEAMLYSTWSGTTASISTQSPGRIPLFLQYAYDVPYAPCGTIATQGCAPTSLAMILTGLGFSNATPPEIANMWQSTGHRRCNGVPMANCSNCYTYHSFLDEPRFLSRYAVTVDKLEKNRSDIIAALQRGTPVMASMGEGRFSNGGHFIVLTGINTDGTIVVNDPGRNPNKPYCREPPKRSCDNNPSDQIYPRDKVPADIIFEDLIRAYAISKK